MATSPTLNGTTAILEPTFTGYVATTQDALILFEACLAGVLHPIRRRPHIRERPHLVRSGNIFIYEDSSGITRWTDGIIWSPSRVLGNFLIYRELEQSFPSGGKKRAIKKVKRRPLPSTLPGEPNSRHDNNSSMTSNSPNLAPGAFGFIRHRPIAERSLVGSLVDSYDFKGSGLVKKTITVTVAGVTHHLVSYYKIEDVMCGILKRPSLVIPLCYVGPRIGIRRKESFRGSIDDETGENDCADDPSHAVIYDYRSQKTMTFPLYAMLKPSADLVRHTAPSAVIFPPQADPVADCSTCVQIPTQLALNPHIPCTMTAETMTAKVEDSSVFRAGSYDTNIDSLSHRVLSNISLPNTAILTSVCDRSRSESDQYPSDYPKSSLSRRSGCHGQDLAHGPVQLYSIPCRYFQPTRSARFFRAPNGLWKQSS